MSHRCRICAQSSHSASDLPLPSVLACPQCQQEFPSVGELHIHVANDRHGPARMFQQPPVGDEAFDPRWAAPYALDVNGNRVPLLTTAAGYALDPVIQYHPGHYIAGGGSGGVIHSPTVTLPGGVTVYIPNAQQEPISSDASQYQLPSTQSGGISSSPNVIRHFANNESERSYSSRFIFPSTHDVAAEALRVEWGAPPMNTNPTLQPSTGQRNPHPQVVVATHSDDVPHAANIGPQPTNN